MRRKYNHGADLSRLMMMIMLLCVVGILFFRARNPETWRWFAKGDEAEEEKQEPNRFIVKHPQREEMTDRLAVAQSNAVAGNEKKGLDQKTAESKSAEPIKTEPGQTKKQSATQSETKESNSSGGDAPIIYKNDPEKEVPEKNNVEKLKPDVPIDQDPNEVDDAQIEFAKVLDKTKEMQTPEMAAYKRLMRWVETQPYEKLVSRASKTYQLHDLLNFPKQERGRLVQMELNACMVVKIDEPPPGFEQYDALYEIWGWKDSPKYLYLFVTPELPEELSKKVKGNRIEEKVTAVGYFFKIQSYETIASREREVAPLFVGRIKWHPNQVAGNASAQNSEFITLWWLGGFGIIFIGYVGLRFWLKRHDRPGYAKASDSVAEESFENWLQSPGTEANKSRDDDSVDWESHQDHRESGEEWKSSYR